MGLTAPVVAVTLGVLHSNSPIGLLAGSGVTTDAMRELPMSLTLDLTEVLRHHQQWS